MKATSSINSIIVISVVAILHNFRIRAQNLFPVVMPFIDNVF